MSLGPASGAANNSCGGARKFEAHELFFSTTDRKGIVTSANAVFERVSGYSRAEILGKPHNIVRHDDMPRIAFKLLWDEIQLGRPFAAYVKNRSSDGSHYWVIATIVPIAGGYLSIRLAPSTEYFQLAEGLYRELRAIEREVEGTAGLRRKEAMAASEDALFAALRNAGYAGYSEFMYAALLAEVRTREETLRESGYRSAPKGPDEGPWGPALGAITSVNEHLRKLVLRLDQYHQLNQQLGDKAALVRNLADDVRLFALNAIISASRAGRGNAAVGAVAELLSARSEVTGPMFGALADAVADASATLGKLLFPVAVASLQAETLETFLREATTRDACSSDRQDLEAVHACFAHSLTQLLELLTGFWGGLSGLSGGATNLQREMDVMRALSLNGRIESARLDHGETFTALFSTVAVHVETARSELENLGNLGKGVLAGDARMLPQLRRDVADVESALAVA